MKPGICLFFLLLSYPACHPTNPKEQHTLQGKVISITDADTFTMLLDNKTTVKVRLASIDCPERNQPYAGRARQFLSDAIFSRQRYWGEPFPVYYKDGIPYTLNENELPLELPEVDKTNTRVARWIDGAGHLQ